jgi:ACDE family multidrug resistance protein
VLTISVIAKGGQGNITYALRTMNNELSTMKTKSQPKNENSIFQDKNFYIINLITVVAILGGTIHNPSLPTIEKFFQVTEEQASWVSTLFQLPGAFITPIFGILADSLGRKQILIPSLLLFGVSGAFSSFAPTFQSLLQWRLFQGIGTASLESLQMTIIADLYRGRQMGEVMAFNASLIGMSSAIFPLLGGILAMFSWRYPFIVALLAIPVSFMVLTQLRLPRHRGNPGQTEKFELKPYLKSTWNSINNRRVFGLLFAIMSLFALQTGTCLTYIPFFAARLGSSEAITGILLTFMSVSLAIAASQLGLFTQKLSEIKLIKLSFLLFAVALVIIPFISNLWLLFIPIFLIGAAQGLALPCTQALLAGLSAQESRAGFMAINSTIQSWGQTLGPLLGGLAVRFWGLQSVFYASAIFALISFGIFNYLQTTKILKFTAQTIVGNAPIRPHQATPPVPFESRDSNTVLEGPVVKLIHEQTQLVFELPENFSLIRIGKRSKAMIPDIDLAELPNAKYVSRNHAEIRFDGKDYYIQDLGSSNGTYILKYPMLPGVWYKLKSGLPIVFGKRGSVSFMFEIS